jgi:poly(A) polymerase
MLGYFGGISLAIMVAKICQLYPNWPPSKLIERFFFIYQYFPWNVSPSSDVRRFLSSSKN